MNFQAVIFDMDGVLIDSEPLWEEAEIKLLKSEGVNYDPLFRDKVVGLNQTDSSKLIIREFGLSCSPERLIERRMEILLGIYEERLSMFEGAGEVIENLRGGGLKTALASSSPMRVISYVLEKFSLGPLFDAVVSGDCVKNGKPAPDIYLLAAEKIDIAPRFCAAVEDSPKGVKSAADAGMFCVTIPDPRLKAEEFGECGAVCGKITEIEEALGF